MRALFGNPGLKLLSLLLAFSVWSLVRSDLEETKVFRPPLVIEVEDGVDLVAELTGESPGWSPEFDVVGPGGELTTLMATRPAVRVRVSEDVIGSELDTKYTVRLADIDFPPAINTGNVRVVKMDPERFDVTVWRMDVRTPAVEPEIEIEGLDELGDSLTVVPVQSPPNLTLRGKAAQVRDLVTVRIKLPRDQLQNIERLIGDRTRDEFPVTYELAEESVRSRFQLVNPSEMNGKVAVSYRKTLVIPVPVRLLTEPADERKLVFPESNQVDDARWIAGDPNQLKVTFEGSPSALGQLEDPAKVAQIRAYVDGSEFPADATSKYLRVRFSGLPDGVVPAGTYEVGVELR